MSLQNVIVIWLDGTFNGHNYESMTNEFNDNIASSTSTSTSSDEIDNLICNQTKQDLVTNEALIITVQTPDEAMKQIANNPEAKIFFIASGRLGRDIVPKIVKQYPQVHSFYIYCFKMVDHVDWALDYEYCLAMFDHQIDLLVRLMRDISSYFIERGKVYSDFNDPNNALKYFKHSWNLETRANERNKIKPNPKSKEKQHVQRDSRIRLDLLEGENGLIHRAEEDLKR